MTESVNSVRFVINVLEKDGTVIEKHSYRMRDVAELDGDYMVEEVQRVIEQTVDNIGMETLGATHTLLTVSVGFDSEPYIPERTVFNYCSVPFGRWLDVPADVAGRAADVAGQAADVMRTIIADRDRGEGI